MIVYGKNTFKEYMDSPKKISKIYISNSFGDKSLMNFIRENKIQYVSTDNYELDRISENGNHQGIAFIIDDYEYGKLEDAFADNRVIILDHLEDPHNFGAIIRTCEASGIKNIIIPKDRSVKVNSTVMKISSGALSHINIIQVSNLVQAIDKLKENNFFIYGCDMDGINYKTMNFSDKCVLVIGSEGFGISPLIKKNCDEIVSIPMYGKVNSLNASVAAAIIIYGVVK